MRYSILLASLTVCSALQSSGADAQSAIDPTASVVELRSSCGMPGGATLDNCFETTSDLTDWLWVNAGTTGRSSEPNSLDGVTVRVGPGVFDRFECVAGTPASMRGWVSVAGAGTELTIFEPSNPLVVDPDLGTPTPCVGGIDLKNCTGMSFQDLTARGPTRGANWFGSGTSVWRDVDFIADPGGANSSTLCQNEGGLVPVYAWYDRFEWPIPDAVHFFWDSRFIVRNANTFVAYLRSAFATHEDENWFYGCDFSVDLSMADTVGSFGDAGILAAHQSDVRIFGSTVRMMLNHDLTGGFNRVSGIQSLGTAVVHVHGSIINVRVDNKASSIDVAGIDVTSAGNLVHTPETAFNIRPKIGSGTSWRIRDPNGANVQSPFQWPASDAAPLIQSVHGQDTFVKTNAGPGADETRLYIYDDSCGSQWRDAGGSGCL